MSSSFLLTAALAAAMALLPRATSAAGPAARSGNQYPIGSTVRAAPAAGASSKGQRAGRRKGAILVKLRADASPAQIQALNAAYAAYGLQLQRRLLGGTVVRLNVSNKAFEDQEETVAAQIRTTGAVEISEPDYLVPLAFVPTDPLYSRQWANTKINAELAWDHSQGSSNILVAVCDAGFDLSHPDLSARFNLPGYNTIMDNGVIDNINDHGTMTSGVLAATGNNSQGMAGMAWQIRLLPIQVSDRFDGVSTYSDIVECIAYAQARGANVVNISYDYLYTSATIDEAAVGFRAAGGLVVVAGGNSGSDISIWGKSPNLIVVGATDQADALTWFSNFGTPVDLYAPGQDMYATTSGNTYGLLSGTSFSTPLVAGTIALLYSLNPQWTPAEVEKFVLSNQTQVGSLGRLNAGATLQQAADSISPTLPPPIELDNLAANVSDASRISTGKWCISRDAGYFGIRSVASCGSKLNTYKFVPTITTTRTYTVYIRYVSKKNLSKKASVKIRDATGTTTQNIDMRVNGGAWVSLGNYNLAAGTSSYLQVIDTNGTVDIDGARFEALP